MSRNRHRSRLTNEEFRKAMRGLGLTVETLARDLGEQPSRVMAWWNGEDRVPNWLALLLAAWTEPGSLTKSRAAAQFLDERGATEAAAKVSAAE